MDQKESPLGKTVGHYKIISSIGVGGMGEVYLAQDIQLGRKVALKLLPSAFTQDKDRVRRFQQEARAASALNHPNIITIYGFGEEEERHFIASEFVDGQTLRVTINETHSQASTDKSGSRLKLNDILDVAMQAADALSAAHEVGIVHRDIKPENIMLRRDGYVKVLDFGLAKLTESPDAQIDTESPTRAQIKTSAGVVMGTASYMSPEQARGEMLDVRTDIWSLGVVIYEMVAGCRPFDESSSNEVIASILQQEPPPLLRYAKEVPAELERIVSKALTKNREERYQTAKDISVDFRRLKQRLEVEAELERTGQKEKDYDDGISRNEEPAVAAVIAPATSKKPFKLQTQTALIILAALAAVTLVAYFAYSRYASGSDAGKIRSIAVLPFTNAGGNADAEYLSDGISESLINQLSQLPGVTVIARSSSFKYKDKEVDPQKVASELGVQAILTGRVVQRGDDLLISAELVNASDRTQVWGEQYNGKATDVLKVQSDISRKIAETLRLKLTSTTQQQLAKSETTNLRAYELQLQGLFYRNMGGQENIRKAIEFFKQATEIDPSYATAYAQLSESYRGLVANSLMDPKDGIPQAKAAALRALELDDNLADAHYALAGLELDEWDWGTAEREYKRAVELNDNLAKAHAGYSHYFSVMGRHSEALAEIRRTRELDPVSPIGKNAAGERLRIARQYDQALESLKASLEANPSYPNLHLTLGRVYEAKGQYTEAISAYGEGIRLGMDTSNTKIYLGTACARGGDRERAEAILKQLTTSSVYVSPTQLAMLYAALGDNEQAFASLERGYAARDLQLKFLGVDPAYDSLRSDPRFHDLLRRIGLAP